MPAWILSGVAAISSQSSAVNVRSWMTRAPSSALHARFTFSTWWAATGASPQIAARMPQRPRPVRSAISWICSSGSTPPAATNSPMISGNWAASVSVEYMLGTPRIVPSRRSSRRMSMAWASCSSRGTVRKSGANASGRRMSQYPMRVTIP